MASSGSFNTSAYSSRYLTFSWSIKSQDIANNKTTINWSLKGAGGTTTSWYTSGNFKVVINGSTVYSSSTRISLYNGTTVASGTATITHNSDGKKSFSASAEAGIYTVAVNCKGSGSWDLTTIPRQATVTSAPDFNDEANPTMNYSNPAGNSVTTLQGCISLTGSTDDIKYRDISKTGSSYTFNLTTAERDVLRKACPNSNSLSVKFYVKTVIGGNTYYSNIQKTMTIVNGNPTFSASNISYKDNNSTTTAVTGNNQKLVQNLSSLLVTLTSATALKGASISKYEATINNTTKSITSAGNIDFGVINSANNLTLSVKVIDSRGNSTTATKSVTFLAWTLPTAVITLRRKNNYEDETYLKAQATYSSVDSKNKLTLQYQFKKTTESSYSALANLSNNTQATMTKDKNSAWDFKILVKDSFGTTTYNVQLAKGRFILFVDTKKLSVGVNCFPTRSEALEINGMPSPTYPVGSIFRSTVNTNPGTFLGGTWTLKTKKVIDTGWQNFSWTNGTYMGTSQSSYTLNKWRIKDNILHVHVGVGATATINTSTEYEIARIPIKGNSSYDNSSKRVWNGAVGGSGAVAGLMIMQNTDYLSVYLKPHTTANNHSAPWYSTYFAIPMDDAFTFASGSHDIEYVWKRTA